MGCKQTKTIKVNLDAATITINQSVTSATCVANSGAINITVAGTGTAPYTFIWTGPGSYTATTEDLTVLMPEITP
jgi:hypothetical protein